ncbi:hypothetical protein [Lactobacillus xylocopicola]|uniref:hypothetical protein n=1 Tax=Lactobacillus xylocopicola TaxID=2976676 RepID=UPI002954722C|nr:hypothetical protein [Lactobacillus xylocopicola]
MLKFVIVAKAAKSTVLPSSTSNSNYAQLLLSDKKAGESLLAMILSAFLGN